MALVAATAACARPSTRAAALAALRPRPGILPRGRTSRVDLAAIAPAAVRWCGTRSANIRPSAVKVKRDADTGRSSCHDAYDELVSVEQVYQRELACLADVEKKSIWLSAYMIHHANNIRPKVLQSSCQSR